MAANKRDDSSRVHRTISFGCLWRVYFLCWKISNKSRQLGQTSHNYFMATTANIFYYPLIYRQVIARRAFEKPCRLNSALNTLLSLALCVKMLRRFDFAILRMKVAHPIIANCIFFILIKIVWYGKAITALTVAWMRVAWSLNDCVQSEHSTLFN